MEKQKSARLKVGVFVLASIAIFVYGVFTISGQEELFEREYKVKTYFNNSAGLLEGAYVRLSGVGVGSVSTIRFSDDSSLGKVQVIMEINKRALSRISKDSHATIKTEGLLGAKFVEIVPGQGESIGKARDGIVINFPTPLKDEPMFEILDSGGYGGGVTDVRQNDTAVD